MAERDPRLDRLVQFDDRSRRFAVADALPPTIAHGRSWSVPARLDQGSEGACVGFGISHELAAYPAAVPNLANDFALGLYNDAKKIDPWPGEDYSGTSVLAGVKAAQARGYFDEYRWCFTIDEILRALSTEGPVVVGTNWYDGMYDPRPSGLIEPTGTIVGGHCYLIRGFSVFKQLPGEPFHGPLLRIRNSWGPGWGLNGDAFITVTDFGNHLMPEGEAVVFMGRHKTP